MTSAEVYTNIYTKAEENCYLQNKLLNCKSVL